MPLLDIQRRMRELGRIRTGQQVASGNGRKRPAKLEHFRLTSPSRPLIEAAAVAYGGQVRAWEGQWEVLTTADTIDVVIPPGQSISQWYEMWSGGGCQRRCDGRTNVLTDTPCACPADPADRRELAASGGACKPTTRLNVILPDIPDLGVWRLESHGYYAAAELSGTVDVLEAADRLLPARLRLEPRESKKPGKPTAQYMVPVLELPTVRISELMGGGPVAPAIPARVDKRERVPRPGLPPGPDPRRATTSAGEAAPIAATSPSPAPTPEPDVIEGEATVVDAEPARCDGFHDALGRCRRRDGHPEKKWSAGVHVGTDDETWPVAA